eukprot:9016540-Pyramimonas_sp.AAC.1
MEGASALGVFVLLGDRQPHQEGAKQAGELAGEKTSRAIEFTSSPVQEDQPRDQEAGPHADGQEHVATEETEVVEK